MKILNFEERAKATDELVEKYNLRKLVMMASVDLRAAANGVGQETAGAVFEGAALAISDSLDKTSKTMLKNARAGQISILTAVLLQKLTEFEEWDKADEEGKKAISNELKGKTNGRKN